MKKRKLTALLVVLALTTACIHKAGHAPVTPWEKVHTYNAALADANQTVEQGAEAVASSGLATPAQVQPLIALTGQVATLHEQMTAILAQGSATSANIASVQALVDQIHSAVQSLPLASLGIKNPKSQTSFNMDVNNIASLADAVLTSLKAVTP